jgi:hypothetical protein
MIDGGEKAGFVEQEGHGGSQIGEAAEPAAGTGSSPTGV